MLQLSKLRVIKPVAVSIAVLQDPLEICKFLIGHVLQTAQQDHPTKRQCRERSYDREVIKKLPIQTNKKKHDCRKQHQQPTTQKSIKNEVAS